MSNKGKCGVMTILAPTEVMVQDYDILLYAGKGRMSRGIVQYQKRFCDVSDEAAQISHVAIVKRNWRYGSLSQDGFGVSRPRYRDGYAEVFESTTLNKWADKKGVQVNPLGTQLKNYDGDVRILPLAFDRTQEHYRKMDKFVMDNVGRPYENGIPGMFEMLFCGLPWVDNEPTDNPHCSENNIRLLQYGGLFDPTAKPNKFPPCQFWPGGTFEKGLPDGVAALEPLLIVK